MAVGAAHDVDACERLGTLLGRDLAQIGISVDFAPVADCALDPENTVIGTRAYGNDPLVVARFAGAFARGLEAGGVAAALKHFPGHGSTATDSHRALPRVTVDEVTFRARDLLPFAAAISGEAAQIVMAGHVVVEAFDRERPASLSPRILTGLLRDELGFEGVTCTDCLQMDAIAQTPGPCGSGCRAGGGRRSAAREPLARSRARSSERSPLRSRRERCRTRGCLKRRSAFARCASAMRRCIRSVASSMHVCRWPSRQRAITVLRVRCACVTIAPLP